MSKKNIVAQVGAFEITKDCGTEHDYLRIKSKAGHWGISYRDDNEMYGRIMAMVRDKEYAKTLEFTIVYMYECTSMLVDGQFAIDFMTALNAMKERIAASIPEPTEEEEAEAIKEAEVMEDMKNHLEDGRRG